MIKEILIKRFNNLWMKYKILKSKEKLNDIKEDDRKIFIFLAADYRNMGDVAITYAQKKFLEDSFKNYKVIEIPADKTLDYIKPIKNIINKKDIITTIGGGNMGNIYEYYESLRRQIIKSFRENLVVSFPQTIDFSNTKKGKKSLKKTIKAINSHKNIIVLAREEKSYNKMKECFGEQKVSLVPDIVLYLKDRINIKTGEKHKIGICFRDDKEEDTNKLELKNNILNSLKSFDIEKFDTYLPEKQFVYEKRYEIFKDLLEKISSYQVIYTNRLHAMVFAYLTNTKCYFIDNSNKKISGTYKLWLNNIKYIKELNGLEDISYGDIVIKNEEEISYMSLFDKLIEKINSKLKEVERV